MTRDCSEDRCEGCDGPIGGEHGMWMLYEMILCSACLRAYRVHLNETG